MAQARSQIVSGVREYMGLRAKILIIEDDLAMQSLISDFLALQGAEVEVTRLACDAMDRLDRDGAKFDLIISDINMPQMSGLEFLRVLKAKLTLPPVLFITAFGNELLKKQAVEAGATAYLDKPFKLSDLLQQVKLVLAASQNKTRTIP